MLGRGVQMMVGQLTASDILGALCMLLADAESHKGRKMCILSLKLQWKLWRLLVANR